MLNKFLLLTFGYNKIYRITRSEFIKDNLESDSLEELLLSAIFKQKPKKSSLTVFINSYFYPFINEEIKREFIINEQVFENEIYCLEIKHIFYPGKKIYIKYLGHFWNITLSKKEESNFLYLFILELQKEMKTQFNVDISGRYICTTASLGRKIFIKMYPQNYKKIKGMIGEHNSFIEDTFFSGRNEIFYPLVEEENWFYDINSYYPFIMKTYPLPSGIPEYINKEILTPFVFYNSLFDFFGFLDITISTPKNMVMPVLPIRSSQKGILFPLGKLRGKWFSEEIKLALENGYKLEAIHSGYRFKPASHLFNAFVDFFFEQKVKYKHDPIRSSFYKLLLNSLYGRLALSTSRETKAHLIHSTSSLNENEILTSTFHSQGNKAIASAITSYGRIHLYRLFAKKPEDILYWDTDGFFTKSPLSPDLIDSSALGKFKLVSKNRNAYFINNKFYFFITEGCTCSFPSCENKFCNKIQKRFSSISLNAFNFNFSDIYFSLKKELFDWINLSARYLVIFKNYGSSKLYTPLQMPISFSLIENGMSFNEKILFHFEPKRQFVFKDANIVSIPWSFYT